jgi:hypothetical protein
LANSFTFYRFRWVKLQLATFFHPRSQLRHSGDVISKLDKLDHDPRSPDLSSVYDEMYDLNVGTGSESQAVTKRAFKWIVASANPLSLNDLSIAAAIRPDGESDMEVNEDFLFDVLSNFIFIENSGYVRFAHISVREYLFDRFDDLSRNNTHAYVGETCLAHLNSSNIDVNQPEEFLTLPNFAQYAVIYWPLHWSMLTESQRNEGKLGRLLHKFLLHERNPKFTNWAKLIVMLVKREHSWSTRDGLDFNERKSFKYFVFSPLAPLYTACAWGFPEVVKVFLRTRAHDNRGTWWFLEQFKTALKMNVASDEEWESTLVTILYISSSCDCVEIVQLLLNTTINLDSQDPLGRTALIQAAAFGHESVARLLIQRGATIDSSDWHGKTALYYAAREGHENLVRLLIESGADVNGKDSQRKTALYRAAGNGHTQVARILLENGAEINANDIWGDTAPYWAYAEGQSDVLDLLLKRDAEWAIFDNEEHEGRRVQAVAFGGFEQGSPGLGLARSGIDDFIQPVGI